MLATTRTLVDVLRDRAEEHPQRMLYRFVRTDGAEPESLTYGEADRRARSLASWLREQTPAGSRALLLYPSSLEYPVVFLACLYAGIVAVPAFPPDKSKSVQSVARVRHIVRDCRPDVILTTEGLRETAEQTRAESPAPERLRVLTTCHGGDLDSAGWRRPADLGGQLAFLQYTSGSTGFPKGVMVDHANLHEHQRLAHRLFGCAEDSTTVSWLPFYHDMGLIGGLLYPLYHGGNCVLLPSTSFLRRPIQWLRTISEYRATTSTAPNFAYEVCIRRAKDEDVASLDLSSWRLSVCGAEPLRPSTLERFSARFAPSGFRPQVFLPCYGGAEPTLVITGGIVERRPIIRSFDADALLQGRARQTDGDGRTFVSCGRPMDEHDLRIVNPQTRVPCDEGAFGEIWLRGPSVARGYWGQPERSAASFDARLNDGSDDDGGFLRTGDLGFVHDGELFVVGRLDDELIVDGRRHQPHDIEQSVEDAARIDGSAIAFQVVREGRSELCVACEVRRSRKPDALEEIAAEVAAAVWEGHGLTPDCVLLVPPRTVAKTSSGKQRRFKYREAWLEGSLEPLRVSWARRASA